MAEKGRRSSGKGSGRGNDADETPRSTDAEGRLSVLVEMRASVGGSPAQALGTAERMEVPGFRLDSEFQPIPMGGAGESASGGETFIMRGTVGSEDELAALREQPDVVEVIPDTPIAPFQFGDPDVEVSESMGACPIPPCDCAPGTPKGTIADVATYLGVNQIWAAGFKGAGIVVGVLDSGITAQGRPVKSGETSRRIPRVIGGWPSDWGTESSKWGDHGNMCATDVLGMAPEAQLYDFRIAGAGGSPGTISRALQAFQWAIDRHKVDGTPHVLTNSWGIFQETWDTTYARNPNHPFTRKVVEAIGEGILVLFAAGNCGGACPDGRCGSDNGPGKSIWGANGHPQVMTVGAVNKNEQFIGYSSQGPAALDPNKPDFCSISHFTGYNISDNGTSAATPILAGVVALLKQRKPSATQSEIKACLKSTAKDIGPSGFDQHSGAGIVQGKKAFDCIRGPILPPRTIGPPCPPIRTLGPVCPPRTIGPPCPPRTIGPPCEPIRTLGPACAPRTIECVPRTMQCGGPPGPEVGGGPQDPTGYDPYGEYGYPAAHDPYGEYGYPSAEGYGYDPYGEYSAEGGEYGYPEPGEYATEDEYGYPGSDPYAGGGEYGYGDDPAAG